MKTGTLREVKEQLSRFVFVSQKEPVLITKHGRPVALVKGVEGNDMEDIFYMTNHAFWKTIKKRRQQKTILWSSRR